MFKLLTDSEKIDVQNTILNVQELITKTKETKLYDNLIDAVECMQLLLSLVIKSEKMLTEAIDPDTKTNYSVKLSEEDIWDLLESDELCNNEIGLNYIDELPTSIDTISRLREIKMKNVYLQKDLEDLMYDMIARLLYVE